MSASSGEVSLRRKGGRRDQLTGELEKRNSLVRNADADSSNNRLQESDQYPSVSRLVMAAPFYNGGVYLAAPKHLHSY